ncbi:hypothetical protein ACFX15_044467 [Malus domestica]
MIGGRWHSLWAERKDKDEDDDSVESVGCARWLCSPSPSAHQLQQHVQPLLLRLLPRSCQTTSKTAVKRLAGLEAPSSRPPCSAPCKFPQPIIEIYTKKNIIENGIVEQIGAGTM